MRPTLVLALLLSFSSPALAQNSAEEAGPVLGDLLKEPKYLGAWQSMLSSEATPDWLAEYTSTLDGPPIPSLRLTIDNQTYVWGYTCKPFECADNQLIVLFAPEGRKAYGLLVTAGLGQVWLGSPDERIRAAIVERLENDDDPS